ncbi:hypothetical protein HMSSN036_40070 [Paenibacillus macerans]|nr:hypothetical protein HMSSN036_40070 [Paenibacillus macerans]
MRRSSFWSINHHPRVCARGGNGGTHEEGEQRFKTAFVSEAGSHFDNRDYFAFVELDDMACYVIADGLDLDKEVRSAQMAVEVILESFMEKPSMSRRKIRQDLEAAHEWLKFESRRVRLKASVLVVVTDYTRMVWATCGNARLYQFRGGRVNLRSKDQSLTQLMLDQGRLAEDRNHNHEERGNLLNYMGRPDRFEPYVSDKCRCRTAMCCCWRPRASGSRWICRKCWTRSRKRAIRRT